MSNDIPFMKLVFQVTKEATEEKEQKVRDMIEGYKKDSKGGSVSGKAEGRGFKTEEGSKSTDALTATQAQELQFEVGQYSQIATTGTNVIKAIKDLLSLIMRNVG